jgi:hypothetical protein
MKDRFYEELEVVFNKFPKYDIKFFLGDFHTKVGREDISNQQSSSRLMSRNVKIRTHKTIILLVVLYWFESWSLPLREEHGLRVFENKVLR